MREGEWHSAVLNRVAGGVALSEADVGAAATSAGRILAWTRGQEWRNLAHVVLSEAHPAASALWRLPLPFRTQQLAQALARKVAPQHALYSQRGVSFLHMPRLPFPVSYQQLESVSICLPAQTRRFPWYLNRLTELFNGPRALHLEE
jgi:hypothetical protein